MELNPPKNQQQLVLWYLIDWHNQPFSMKDVINDSMFYKFPSRLSELEKKFGFLAERENVKFKNRFGNRSVFCLYKTIDRERCIDIYKNLQKDESN